MRNITALFLLLASCVLAGAATVFPASTNGNNVFTGNNTFTKPITGNGAGLTNLISTNEVFVTVSSRGVKNACSTIPNGGANFGPDTPGTSTCGLQEAMNLVNANATGLGVFPGVGLKLGGGDFYFTNALWCSNFFPCSLTIEGQDTYSTRLIYAGAGGTNALTVTGRQVDNYNIQPHLSKFTLTSLIDTTNVLAYVCNFGYVEVKDCWFASPQVTNLKGSSSPPPGMTNMGNLVGLKIGSITDPTGGFNYDGMAIVKDSVFSGMAVGIDARADHFVAENNNFNFCGQWELDGQGITTNLWPNNNIYRLGTAILRWMGMDSHYSKQHFWQCGVCINTIENMNWNRGTNHFMVDPYNDDGGILLVANHPERSYFSIQTADPELPVVSNAAITNWPNGPFFFEWLKNTNLFVRKAQYAATYVSPETNTNGTGIYTFTHNLGTTPQYVRAVMRCKVDDGSGPGHYLAGDEVAVQDLLDFDPGNTFPTPAFTVVANSTNIVVLTPWMFGYDATRMNCWTRTVPATLGEAGGTANWRLVVRAKAE